MIKYNIDLGDLVTHVEDGEVTSDFVSNSNIHKISRDKILEIRRPTEYKNIIQVGEIDLIPGDVIEYINHKSIVTYDEWIDIEKNKKGYYHDIYDYNDFIDREYIKSIKRPIQFAKLMTSKKIKLTEKERNLIARYFDNMLFITIEGVYNAMTFKVVKYQAVITLKDNSRIVLDLEDDMFSSLEKEMAYYKEEFDLEEK